MSLFVLPYVNHIVIALSVLVLILLIWVIYTEVRLRRFMRGKKAKSLEEAIEAILKDNEKIEIFKKDMKETLKNFHSRLTGSARGISTVRFNAFGGRGESGAQSFATAILDENGDGVVFSSIHTRDNTRVYAKPLLKFDSKHELSDEEKEAIKESAKKTKK